MGEGAKKGALAKAGSAELKAQAEGTLELHPDLEAKLESIIDAKVAERMVALESKYDDIVVRVEGLEEGQLSDRVTILVFSGDFDRLMTAFIIATGAVAMGSEVTMYFTFWGLTALKKKTTFANKSILEKMVSVMMPGGPKTTGTSRMNFMGMGPVFFKTLMKKNNVETLPDLIDLAQELEVEMVA